MNTAKAIFFNEPIEGYFLGHQFSEVYRDRIYEPYLPKTKSGVCLDLGSNIGTTIYYFSRFFEKVIGVEPSNENFDLLKKMVEYNELTNVQLIKAAIASTPGESILHHNQNKTMFSLSEAIEDRTILPEKVTVTTIEEIMSKYSLEHINLLKLDIEGEEYNVIGHESFSRVSDKIDAVVGESHTWANRNPNQLKESFKVNGFDFKWIAQEPQLFVATKRK